MQWRSAAPVFAAMCHKCGSPTVMGLCRRCLVDVPFTLLFPGGCAIHAIRPEIAGRRRRPRPRPSARRGRPCRLPSPGPGRPGQRHSARRAPRPVRPRRAGSCCGAPDVAGEGRGLRQPGDREPGAGRRRHCSSGRAREQPVLAAALAAGAQQRFDPAGRPDGERRRRAGRRLVRQRAHQCDAPGGRVTAPRSPRSRPGRTPRGSWSSRTCPRWSWAPRR